MRKGVVLTRGVVVVDGGKLQLEEKLVTMSVPVFLPSPNSLYPESPPVQTVPVTPSYNRLSPLVYRRGGYYSPVARVPDIEPSLLRHVLKGNIVYSNRRILTVATKLHQECIYTNTLMSGVGVTKHWFYHGLVSMVLVTEQ